MATYIETSFGGKTYLTELTDIEFDSDLMFCTMHFSNGSRHLYLYQHNSWPQIANSIFRSALTARSVKGLLDEFVNKGKKMNWVIGSAVALAGFLKNNHYFQTEGYYDSEGKLQIEGVVSRKHLIYK